MLSDHHPPWYSQGALPSIIGIFINLPVVSKTFRSPAQDCATDTPPILVIPAIPGPNSVATIPGFTATTAMPLSLKSHAIDFETMCTAALLA